MLKFIKKEYVTILDWAFRICYLLLTFATFNVFLYDSAIQPVLVKLCIALGGLTIVGRICFFRNYVKTSYWRLLMVFCLSFGMSIFMNRAYGGVSADVKWLVWTGFLFFLLYVCDTTREVASYKKEFTVFAHIMIAYGTFAASAGIHLMFSLYKKQWYTVNKEKLTAGFSEGRLWGVYTDPNYGGVFTVVVILLSIYFLRNMKRWRKILYILVLIPNCFYIICSGSRTAALALITAICFWVVYTTIYKYGMIRSVIISLVFLVFFLCAFFGGASYVIKQYNLVERNQITVINVKKVIENQIKKENIDVALRRKELLNDVSSGRTRLWVSGFEVWKTSPIYGTGYNSFIPYAKQNVPDTYAIKESGREFMSLHNNYLNVLVYQGLIGFAILLLFMFLVLKRYWKGIQKIPAADKDYAAVLSACVLVVAISMFFLLDGFYTNSPESFVLWTFLGYLMHSFTSLEEAEK